MVMGAFRRPVGAVADVNELVYVSALHQTAKHIRSDGSISANDIVLYLRSRYGIDVPKSVGADIVLGLGWGDGSGTPNQVRNAVATNNGHEDDESQQSKRRCSSCCCCCCRGRGRKKSKKNSRKNVSSGGQRGGASDLSLEILLRGDSHQDECLDLVQLTSILLIPTLLRLAKDVLRDEEGENKPGISSANDTGNDEEKGVCAGRLKSCFRARCTNCRKRDSEDEEKGQKAYALLHDVLYIILSPVLKSGDDDDSSLSSFCSYYSSRTQQSDEFFDCDGQRVQVKASKSERRSSTFSQNQFEIKQNVDASVMRQILESHNLVNKDDDCDGDNFVIQEMLESLTSAKVPNVEQRHQLDVKSFARALVSDVDYDNIVENTSIKDLPMTTSLGDVFGFELEGCGKKKRNDDNDDDTYIPPHATTMPQIDSVADTYRSLTYLVMLWVLYLFSVALYAGVLGLTFVFQTDTYCQQSFGCNVLVQIMTWTFFAVALCLSGMIIIIPLSQPNSPFDGSCWTVLWTTFLLAVYTLTPALLVQWYRNGIPRQDGVLTPMETLVNSKKFVAAEKVVIAMAALLAVFQCFRFVKIFLLDRIPSRRLRRWLAPQNTLSTVDTKIAAALKLSSLLQNAIKLHFHNDDHQEDKEAIGSFFAAASDLRRILPFKQQTMGDLSHVAPKCESSNAQNAMRNFVLHGETKEQCGGFFWTWKRILSKDLYRKEGVWIHSRLFVGQVAQIITTIFVGFVLITFTFAAVETAEEARDKVEQDPGPSTDLALWFIPETWMIYWSFLPGIGVSMAVCITLILVYVPSTVATILKLRCGLLPYMSDPNIKKYRASAGLLFLAYWPVTRDLMVLFAAWGVGLSTTIAVKYILMVCCRAGFYTSLYRKRPGYGNVAALAMECWHLGIGGGAMIGRLCQFLFAAAFWVGRVDVAFLANHVELMGYSFDYAPTYYRKEILTHEAHRHPFLERLSTMYLMRLVHGKNFCKTGGVSWRLLLVSALMPWLMKYRSHAMKEPAFKQTVDALLSTGQP